MINIELKRGRIAILVLLLLAGFTLLVLAPRSVSAQTANRCRRASTGTLKRWPRRLRTTFVG